MSPTPRSVLFAFVVAAPCFAVAQPAAPEPRVQRQVTEDDHVRIDITDSGVGIPAENRARIFEPFFTTRAVGKGSGQGLAIAYAIVTGKHGGQLSCVSEVGRGSTFSLRLAVGVPPAASAATAGDDAHSPARAA